MSADRLSFVKRTSAAASTTLFLSHQLLHKIPLFLSFSHHHQEGREQKQKRPQQRRNSAREELRKEELA